MTFRVDEEQPAREPSRRSGRAALLVALSAGWGALFSYAAFYLSDDRPARPPTTAERTNAPREDTALAATELAARSVPPPAAAAQPPVAERPPVVPAVETAPALSAAIATSKAGATAVPASLKADRPDYVGVWGPNEAACGSRSRRRGYLPAAIDADGAKAGRTVCGFRDGHKAGNTWTVSADCRDRGRRWTSQVRLTVEGDRLTWASAKGTSAYVRCRRAG
ncbi:MAG: peptidase inhibitor family I36 protein [Methylobacterium sp. CG08_land_8_20_14_0_20_71_15]|nr:MAG: peptidase inhibitor family I36 protein [Methylobacterium sp. CG09_land_8_20_14_0_10_71_15]PIU16553.1 MAG: peptidase inhibitor family I36 protein [Methylobacterium sp. CG08_land_8_20_14_0_20_71_15]